MDDSSPPSPAKAQPPDPILALIAHGLTDPRVAGAYPPDPYPGEDVDAYMARLIHTAPPSDLADQDDEVIDTSDPAAVRAAITEASFAARLESALASGTGTAAATKQGDSQAKRLVKLAAEAELFHTPGGEPYADVPVDDHTETWHLRSRGLRYWLIRRFYEAERQPPSAQALADALGVLGARAQFDGPESPVYVRVGADADRLYLDLANVRWEAVEITTDGWRVVAEPAVHFRRARGMLPLPPPMHGQSLAVLRDVVNVARDDDFALLLAFLVSTIRPTGPFPILLLQGEQGSAKSTTARLLRSLIDPSSAPLQSQPREERDLAIAANNSWLLAFDNVSDLKPWISDDLCRLATGGGLRTRELYSDADEVIFDAQRPAIVNGIADLAERDDLRDRALIVTLPPMDDAARQDEATLWATWAAALPGALGALCTAASTALRNLPATELANPPRMADFARWAVASEPALPVAPGTFLRAYATNRQLAVEHSVEFTPVSEAIRSLAIRGAWEGSASELLDAVNDTASEQVQKGKEWPKSPRGLRSALERAAPGLRGVGIAVTFVERTSRQHRSLIRLAPTPRTPDPMRPLRPDTPQLATTELSGGASSPPGRNDTPPEPDTLDAPRDAPPENLGAASPGRIGALRAHLESSVSSEREKDEPDGLPLEERYEI